MVVVFLLAFASLTEPIYAEWDALGETPKIIVYIDPATIQREGRFVKMWNMVDFKSEQRDPSGSYWSVKAHHEYDCSRELARMLWYAAFSGHMGQGKIVFSNPLVGEWIPLAPESPNLGLWKTACGTNRENGT